MPAFATSGDVALKPGFDRIEALLEGMGHPERNREIILVAGTNGKGTTASMLAAMSTAAGVRTGLHTSPHLVHVSERMRVDGVAPSEIWLANQFERFEPLFKRVEPSFFEATLALSLSWFAEQNATRWVVEIGLGGRLDAANVLDADVSILTSVGRDHMHLLGPTLAHVAREKAAIARSGRPFILGPLPTEARDTAMGVLEEIGAGVIEPRFDLERTEPKSPVSLVASRRIVPDVVLLGSGSHQVINATLALEALDALHDQPVPDPVVRDAIVRLSELSGLRARQEWIRPDVMIDVCHNEEALRASLRVFLEHAARTNPKEVWIILGVVSDKDLGDLGKWLLNATANAGPVTMKLFTAETPGVRGRSATETAEALRASGWDGPVELVDGLESVALESDQEDRLVFIGGSYLMAAAAIQILG